MSDTAAPTAPTPTAPAPPAAPATPTAPIGLFDRALRRIGTIWRDMADRVAPGEDDDVAGQMRAILDARGGEVSARNRAASPGRCAPSWTHGAAR